MQHTDKYHFNLIETSDTFSPEALNENARTAEKELAALADAHAADKAALEAADAALAAGQLVYTIGKYSGKGTYGSGNKNKLAFDFNPIVVFVCPNSSGYSNFGSVAWVRGMSVGASSHNSGSSVILTWAEQSVSWYGGDVNTQMNSSGVTFYYLAIGVAV